MYINVYKMDTIFLCSHLCTVNRFFHWESYLTMNYLIKKKFKKAIMNTQNNVHVNKVHLIGNLGKDVQINVYESGKKKGSFSLATNESYKNLKGEYITNTTWHNIVLWGAGVEKLEGISKGAKVEVTGRLASRSYTNGEGQRKFITEVNALQVKILESVSFEVPMPVI